MRILCGIRGVGGRRLVWGVRMQEPEWRGTTWPHVATSSPQTSPHRVSVLSRDFPAISAGSVRYTVICLRGGRDELDHRVQIEALDSHERCIVVQRAIITAMLTHCRTLGVPLELEA